MGAAFCCCSIAGRKRGRLLDRTPSCGEFAGSEL
jgi:hypothetical protein